MNGIEIPFCGNLTRDVELRYTSGGRGVGSTAVAVSRRYQKDGEWQEQTTFLNLTIWSSLGENCAASLSKGMRVVGVGRLEQRSYETQEGEKRTVFEVVVDSIGPDLRWAQVRVEKTEREKPAERSTEQPSGGADRPAYMDVEEPF